MNDHDLERRLRERLHQAITPALPADAAVDSVLRSVRDRASINVASRPIMRRFATLVGATLAFAVFAGLLTFALVVRHQPTPRTPAPAVSQPPVSPPPVSAPVVPGCSAPSSGGSATVTSPTPSPTTAASQSTLLDLTWISDQVGWALGRSPCGAAVCAHIFSTGDGGQTWHQRPDPPAASPAGCQASSGCDPAVQPTPLVSHIRFASETVGYVWGRVMFMTTDAGQTWQYQPSGNIESLEPSGGTVYRLQYTGTGCPGPCNRTVWKSTLGSASWQQLYALPSPPNRGVRATLLVTGVQTLDVTVFGDLAGGGTEGAAIYRSLDGGATWTTVQDPCLRGSTAGQTQVAVDVATALGGFIAVLCEPRVTQGTVHSIVTSTNSGTSWGALHRLPDAAIQAIAASDSTHVVVATEAAGANPPSGFGVYTSVDGGVHWTPTASDTQTPVADQPVTAYLGFETATTGRWAEGGNAIWTTTDGGAHWRRSGFPS